MTQQQRQAVAYKLTELVEREDTEGLSDNDLHVTFEDKKYYFLSIATNGQSVTLLSLDEEGDEKTFALDDASLGLLCAELLAQL